MIDSCVSHVAFNGYRKPCAQPWEKLRQEIAAHLGEGWGCAKLAKKYGVSTACIQQNLKKLGLRTKHQIEAAEVAAEVASRLAALEKAPA